MSIYITSRVGGRVRERVCFGGLFSTLANRDFDDDEDWDNEVVYFHSADRYVILDRGSLDEAAQAWAALVEWFFPNHEPHFIGTDNLTDPDTITALFCTDEDGCNIPIYPQEAMRVETSYLPLACHIIRAPYVDPKAILRWYDMVKGGFSPEDALRLAFNLMPVAGVQYKGVETRGWVSRYDVNGDYGVPFSGEHYALLRSTKRLRPVSHDDCFELSRELVRGTVLQKGLKFEHKEVEPLYQVRPDLRERYGDNPKYNNGWGAGYVGMRAVMASERVGKMYGILTDTNGKALSLSELRDILYS